jgi:crotonobetainyl-CoA:carnitine CoA-transferase CaiB-like acyl-CoA transferase
MSNAAAGPLVGVRVVELASEIAAWAGKLMGDMGADVVLVEPPGGHHTRTYAPFVDDIPHPDRSLWFWNYNSSKRGVTLDLETPGGRDALRRLLAGADVFLEGEPPGALARLGLDYPDLQTDNHQLIMVSVTPYGRTGPRAHDVATDLTLLAGGGPVWSSGYDDHTLPPVRGGGNQAYHIASHFAVIATLTALICRDEGGPGQHIDVNAHAAANVTTENASYGYLVARSVVRRLTGRHAGAVATPPSQIQCADGRYINTGNGTPARYPKQFRGLHDWLGELDLLEGFESAPVLEWAAEGEVVNRHNPDPSVGEKLHAGREAVDLIASHVPAYEFFTEGQRRGIQAAIVYSPEECIQDPHMLARGFPVEIEHPELGRTITYPGVPLKFMGSPMRVSRRAPLLDEHTAEILKDLNE